MVHPHHGATRAKQKLAWEHRKVVIKGIGNVALAYSQDRGAGLAFQQIRTNPTTGMPLTSDYGQWVKWEWYQVCLTDPPDLTDRLSHWRNNLSTFRAILGNDFRSLTVLSALLAYQVPRDNTFYP